MAKASRRNGRKGGKGVGTAARGRSINCGTLRGGVVTLRVRGDECRVEWDTFLFFWCTDWLTLPAARWFDAFDRKGDIVSFVQKRTAPVGPAASGAGQLGATCAVLGSMPAVLEYLTLAKFEDGSPRELSNLLFFVEDGRIKGCLNDRANECSLWRSGEDLLDVLKAMDEALQSGTADWRASKGKAAKRR